MTLLAIGLIIIIGLLIGAVGVGGFLVVPILVFVDGRPLRDAVIAATVSFLGSGIIAALSWIRDSRFSENRNRVFLLAAAPGALLGAMLVRVISGTWIGLLIAIAVGLAGLGQLFGLPRTAASPPTALGAFVSGLVTGTGSALTGTSGPLIAMPLLARGGTGIVERIRVSQVSQLPIAATAAAVFLVAGDIAWMVAMACSAALAVGVVAGMRITLLVTPKVLSRTSAVLMLITGCAMLGSTLLTQQH